MRKQGLRLAVAIIHPYPLSSLYLTVIPPAVMFAQILMAHVTGSSLIGSAFMCWAIDPITSSTADDPLNPV